MLDKFTYTNHLGEVIRFGESPYFVNQSDLRDYEWEYDDKLTRFHTDSVVQKTLPIVIVADDVETASQLKNRLYEVFETDVLAKQKGTFEVNGYKMKAYAIGSKKSNYLISKKLLYVELKIVTDTPRWIEEKKFSFFPEIESESPEDYGRNYDQNREYPYGYDLDVLKSRRLNNDNFYSCGFIMTIYGAVENPVITIGGKIYRVNVTVEAGEYLKIVNDGTTKEITLFKNDGTTENCFAYRYKPQSVFAKIEPGIQEVLWNDGFGFEITLLKERSEPEWK
jgi:hypothetical protein